jgi:MFS family permease
MTKRYLLVLMFLSILIISVTASVSAQYEDEPRTTDDSFMGMMCMIYACASIFSLILWVIVTIYIYNDANKLGVENAWLWALLVILTGVIGLIVYLVAIRPKAKEQQMMRQGGPPRYGGGAYAGFGDMPRKDGYCRHCGRFVGATVGRCTFCGSNL